MRSLVDATAGAAVLSTGSKWRWSSRLNKRGSARRETSHSSQNNVHKPFPKWHYPSWSWLAAAERRTLNHLLRFTPSQVSPPPWSLSRGVGFTFWAPLIITILPHHPPPRSPAGRDECKHGGECSRLAFPCTHPAFQAVCASVYLNVVSRNSAALWKPESHMYTHTRIHTHIQTHTDTAHTQRGVYVCFCMYAHTCMKCFLLCSVDNDASELSRRVRLMDGFALLCRFPAHWSQFDPVFFFFFCADWRLHASAAVWPVNLQVNTCYQIQDSCAVWGPNLQTHEPPARTATCFKHLPLGTILVKCCLSFLSSGF